MAPTREEVLKKEVELATKAIEGVTLPKTWGFNAKEGSSRPGRVEVASTLNQAALASAKAVGFFNTKKLGAVFAQAQTSKGFFVRNLGWENGQPKWSAPCFFEITTGGVGAALGYETLSTCYCLMTTEAVEKFVTKRGVLGADVHIRDGFYQDKRQTGDHCAEDWSLQELGLHWHTDDLIAFNVAHGAMVQVAINGGQMKPRADNAIIYGEKGLDAQDIMSGKFPAPPEFTPVYERLTKMAVGGATLLKWQKEQGANVEAIPGL